MTHTIVRYTVGEAHAARNAELVRAVYAELAELAPSGFSYAGPGPLPGLASFQEFRRDLELRCEAGPAVSGAELIGRFG